MPTGTELCLCEPPVLGKTQVAGRHIPWVGHWTGVLETRTATPLGITLGGTQSPGRHGDIAGSSRAAPIRSSCTMSASGLQHCSEVGAFSLDLTDSVGFALRTGTLLRNASCDPEPWNLDALVAERIEVLE